MMPFVNDPLMPHLMDIVQGPASEGSILSGGLGGGSGGRNSSGRGQKT